MPLFLTNLNPTDCIRVGQRPHVTAIAPPAPAYSPRIDGRDIVLPDIPTDLELQIDNKSGLLKKRLLPTDFTDTENAPLNVFPPTFSWGVYDTGERHGDILILNSGGWLASDVQVNDDDPANTITYVSELIHSDGITILWTDTGSTVPLDHRFDIGDQLHGLTLSLRVTATYNADGAETVATTPVPIPTYVQPPNLWLQMLNDEDTEVNYKGVPDLEFSFDPVAGDTTIKFPTAVDEIQRSPRIGIGDSLNPNLDHTISFEIHAASEEEADLIGQIIGTGDAIKLFDMRPALENGFCTITKTMRPTESGGLRFDLSPANKDGIIKTPGAVVLRNVQIRET